MSAETPCQHPDCRCHAPAPLPKPFVVNTQFVLICLGAVALISLVVYLLVPLRWLLGQETMTTQIVTKARFLGMTLNIYAHENAGQYPQLPHGVKPEDASANDVYAQLLPHYMHWHREKFHINGSPWTPEPLGAPRSTPREVLAGGENHFAYVAGLNREMNGMLPLVADGFVEGHPGTYGRTPGERGFIESGRPVVITVNGTLLRPELDENGRALTSGETRRDLFAPSEGGLTPVQIPLNPAK